jgi:hypothetical protein
MPRLRFEAELHRILAYNRELRQKDIVIRGKYRDDMTTSERSIEMI